MAGTESDRRVAENLDMHYRDALRMLAVTVEHATGGGPNDVERLMSLCAAVAGRIGLTGEQVELVSETARFRDLGKVDVPISILSKPGTLARHEWEEVRRHPTEGERLLIALPGNETLARAVRHVHERWDGTGYPDGLSGTEIPRASRVVLCCAAFDVMRRDRPGRPALAPDDAWAEIVEDIGTAYDPAVVAALGAVIEERRPDLDPFRPGRLLVVEDSRIQRELMRRALSGAFPERPIDDAESGAAAIEFLVAAQSCAGVVCDLDLEAEEASMRVIRMARTRHGHVPIIAISARLDDSRRAAALDAGADAVLDKGPRTLAELPNRLGALGGFFVGHG